MAAGDGFCEGAFEQDLGDPRLGVDVGALAEQDEADEGEEEGSNEAGHCRSFRHCDPLARNDGR
jgi:hypothetical protein